MTTLTTAMVLASIGFAPAAFAHGVTSAKAIELAFHRVERLVLLCNLSDSNSPPNVPGMAGYDPTKCKNDVSKPAKGIDPDFQNKVRNVELTLLPHDSEEDPSFRIVARQYPGADGSQRAVEIILDEEGRPLTHTVSAGAAPANAPTWADKDATTISEGALHYVQETSVTDAAIRRYAESMSQLSIVPGFNAANVAIAVVDIRISSALPILRIRMKLNGEFESAEYVNSLLPLEPTYASIKRQIFDRRCVICHRVGGGASDVLLAPLQELLDSPRELVLPGNSEESGLYLAVSRTDDRRMPPPDFGSALSDEEISVIRQWIDLGAPEGN